MTKKLLAIPLLLVGLATAFSVTAVADPSDDAYLTTLEANGVPNYGEDYVIGLGHKVCATALANPSMEVVDIAKATVTSEHTPYDDADAAKIVLAAFAAYCPDAA